MAKKFAIRALQRGVGSMEFIDMLLIMEDPDESSDESSVAPLATPLDPSTSGSSSTDQPTPLASGAVVPRPTSTMENFSEPVPDWCKCGQCRTMPQEIENKCCNQRSCVSLCRRFQKLCLDPEYLQLSIRNTNDIRNDRDDNSSRAFRKTACRHFIISMATWEKTRERFVHLAVCWPSGGTTLHQQGYTWVFDPIDFKNAPFRIVSSLMHVSNQEVDLTIEKHPEIRVGLHVTHYLYSFLLVTFKSEVEVDLVIIDSLPVKRGIVYSDILLHTKINKGTMESTFS